MLNITVLWNKIIYSGKCRRFGWSCCQHRLLEISSLVCKVPDYPALHPRQLFSRQN